ncbi:MAG: hypothetical protein AB7S26_37715 [Sandaracinaceae bacterium]
MSLHAVRFLALFSLLAGCAADVASDSAALVAPAGAATRAAPPSAAEIATLALPGENQRVIVQAHYAFVVGGAGLYVVDVHDATAPFIAKHVSIGYYAWDLALENGYAFVAAGSGGVAIVDVSSPPDAHLVALHPTGSEALGIDVALGRAVVALGNDGIDVLDVSDPLASQTVGHLAGGYPEDVAIVGDRVYVARTFEGVRAYRMAQSGTQVSLVLEGRNSTFAYAFHLVHHPAMNVLYVADAFAGLRTIDAEPDPGIDPSVADNLASLGALGMPQFVFTVDVDGDDVAVANTYHGWRLVNGADPSALAETLHIEPGGTVDGVDLTRLHVPGVGRPRCLVTAESSMLRIYRLAP